MATRSRYGFDEKKIARFLKEGRGSGVGADYKPWFTVKDVPSEGRSHRILGRITNRIHHLLSDLERNAFLIYEFQVCIEDIREQFPLDRDETREIAAAAGIRHPADSQSRTDLVQTTDLIIDIRMNGILRTIARSVKPASKLSSRRVIEKLEIERRYWAARKVDWGIISERELPRTMVQNLIYLQTCPKIDALEQPFPGYYRERALLIANELVGWRSGTLKEFCAEMDRQFVLQDGCALLLVRNLLADRIWETDLNRQITDTMPMASFQATGVDSKREVRG